jgi:excisionase family DNA binding protein
VTVEIVTADEFAALLARVADLEARLAATTAPSPWLSIQAAASYLGLTEHATRKFIDRRQIPKHQEVRGGRVLICRADLDAALTTGER